jgi:hypothetical protein
MSGTAIRLDSTLGYVAVPAAVQTEFTRLKLASASTQTLRQYLNASGPHLLDFTGCRRPGLYTDAIVAQYIIDLGI